MITRASIPTLWRSTIFLVIGAVAIFFAFHSTCAPTLAQEQSTTAPQPASSQPPATPPPAAAPAEKPEAKPETEKPEASPAKAEKAKAEELTNESCIDCHNPDILKKSKEDLADEVVVDEKPLPARSRPPFVFGELNLAIKEKQFGAGVHGETTCVSCHKDVKEIPHNQRLKSVDCRECHDDSVESIAAGAHGTKMGPKAPGCVGCHDVHYGKGQGFARQTCLDCHKAYGMDTAKQHQNLYESGLHLTMDCMVCHKGDKPGVHNMLPVKTKVAGCDSCHTKATILSKEKMKPTGFMEYVTKTGFINSDSLKKFGYVVGAHRIPALDAIMILAVLATFGLPIVHGGLRFLTRRKGPIELPEEKILLHPLIERIWHWFQALCIVMLIITGIVLHWPEKFPGWFQWAVKWHNWFGMAAVIAFLVWLVYNLITGRISHYFPKKGEIPTGMIKQAKFYGFDIFKHKPHPYAPTEDNKFNPLQKIAYLQFQVILLPILLISGLLYMYPETFKGFINAIGGMTVLGIVHFILGGLFAAFLVAHLYLATTGETVGENFKAIVFGYGIKSDHSEHV